MKTPFKGEIRYHQYTLKSDIEADFTTVTKETCRGKSKYLVRLKLLNALKHLVLKLYLYILYKIIVKNYKTQINASRYERLIGLNPF